MTEPRKPEQKQKREWLSISAAAKALKSTNYSVMKHIADGEVTTHIFDGRRFVSRKSIEALGGDVSCCT